MNNKTIHSELDLIAKMASVLSAGDSQVVVGIGDDAAVIQVNQQEDSFLLVTTDMLVEDVHFSCKWAGPAQIGYKAAACNLSDIAAMGGKAHWMFVSIGLPAATPETWVLSFCQGLKNASMPFEVAVAGGDTCRSEKLAISITLLGSVKPEDLCLRSQALPGDLLVVSGPLGGSAAGLALLENQMPASDYLMNKHLTPACRLDIASRIAPLSNAMIDISDGLASESGHICRQSRVGAILEAAAIPLAQDVVQAARKLGTSALDFALYGGEDFELLFTIAPQNFKCLEKQVDGLKCIGKITAEPGLWLMDSRGRKRPVQGGFDHFRPR